MYNKGDYTGKREGFALQQEIVGIGAANVDIMGESTGKLVMEDSNPGTLSVSVGGVTRNVCENTARLGLPDRKSVV